MATKKISQLETISDANLSGEAILPVVVSDPLIPNRKAKVNQLFRGISQGTKASPGLAFDLDRDTGLYQTAYDQLGIAFGDGGFYCSRIDNGNSSTSLYITAQDDVATNTDIVLAPKGTGAVKVTGQFLMEDGSFVLEGNGTTLVGADTQQTLTNKTILINENNFVIVDGTEEAIFQINWATTSGARRSYFLPDAGSVTTTSEPTATSSTLLDTKAEQIALSKTFVNMRLAANAESATAYAQWNTDAVTANRILTVPDQSGTIVMEDTTQIMSNKSIQALQLADTTDVTKKITFDVSNQNTLSNESFQVPPTNSLNRSGNHNVIVTERGDQGLYYKSMYNMSLKDSTNATASVVLSAEGITGPRTIKFPDADATR